MPIQGSPSDLAKYETQRTEKAVRSQSIRTRAGGRKPWKTLGNRTNLALKPTDGSAGASYLGETSQAQGGFHASE